MGFIFILVGVVMLFIFIKIVRDQKFAEEYAKKSPKAWLWRKIFGEDRAVKVIRKFFGPIGIFAGFIFLIFGIYFWLNGNINSSEPPVTFSTDNYTVFSKDYGSSFLTEYDKRYTPTKEEVEKGLNVIGVFLDEQSSIRDLGEYKTQVIGYINNSGEKVMYVNYFCSTFGADWTKEFVSVDDGGNCFFQVKVNLDTENTFDFYVNGDA